MDPLVTRSCGLCRTTRALPASPDEVGPGRLVMFHNHSAEGPPVVHLPAHNRANRWHFQSSGLLIRDPALIDTLVPLQPEGFYRLREHFHPDDQRVVAANALVQLGYNAEAEPILFFPTHDPDTNGLRFPDRGMKIPEPIYQLLERLDLQGPHAAQSVH